MTIRSLFVLVFVIIISFISNESFSQSPKIITLKEAISLAKENNSDLVTARLEKQKAVELVKEAYSKNLIPTLTLNSRFQRNFKKQVINIFGQNFEVGQDNAFTSTFDLQESIPILGTPVFQGIRIAEYFEKLQEENIVTVGSKVLRDVKTAYYAAQLTKEVVELQQERLKNATENLQVVELQYKGGTATEFDYLRARVNVGNIVPQLEEAENNDNISKKYLRNIIGLTSDRDIDITGNLRFDSTEVYSPSNSLIEQVAITNSQIKQLEINNRINEELVNVEKANFMPKLFLFGQYRLSAEENDDRSLSNYRFYNTFNAGLGLTWNLNLFTVGDKVAQAEIEVKKSEESIKNLKLALETQTESVILRIDVARNKIITQEENVRLAERSLELANLSFKNGFINQIDVLNTELTLSQTKLAYLEAIYDYLVAKAELEELIQNQ